MIRIRNKGDAITHQLLITLKAKIKTNGLTYRAVGKKLGLSEVTVKRLFSGDRLSLAKLQGIAEILQIPLSELLHEAETSQGEPVLRLSQKQEQVLASDFRLYSFFVLLIYRVPVSQIMAGFNISRARAEKYLLALDRIGIIEQHRDLRYRLLAPSQFSWQKGGPIETKILNPLAHALFKGHLTQGQERIYEFFVTRMTPGLVTEFSRRFRILSEELFARALREDSAHPDAINVGFMLVLRPFRASVIKTLERR
jgi:transcriptional regulator with XRE-family HTH domain